jgi:hypothetical protein
MKMVGIPRSFEHDAVAPSTTALGGPSPYVTAALGSAPS